MTRLRQDAYAVRTFAKAPGFTAIAIIVLAIDVGANTAMFSIVNEFMLRPLSGHTSEMVGAYSHDRTAVDAFRLFSYPNYADIRAESGLFDGLIAHRFTTVSTSAGDETRRSLAALVSSNYFDTLGVRLAAGRTFTAEEERPGAGIPVAIATYTACSTGSCRGGRRSGSSTGARASAIGRSTASPWRDGSSRV